MGSVLVSKPSSRQKGIISQKTLGTATIIVIALVVTNSLLTYFSTSPDAVNISTFMPQIIAVILLSAIFLGLRTDI